MKIIYSLIFLLYAFSSHAQNQDITIERETFSLKHPQSWKTDTADTDYDPDALFSIEGPDGGSFMMFIIFDSPIDTDQLLAAQLSEFKKTLIKNQRQRVIFLSGVI